jgi:two-component system KDP operon response regulator KdpE
MSVDRKILVVSADSRFQHALHRNLAHEEYEVKATRSRNDDLLKVLIDVVPDLAILDTPLASMQGIQELIGIRSTMDVPIMMLSTQGARADTVRTLSIGSGNHPYIKPITLEQLMFQINNLLNKN